MAVTYAIGGSELVNMNNSFKTLAAVITGRRAGGQSYTTMLYELVRLFNQPAVGASDRGTLGLSGQITAVVQQAFNQFPSSIANARAVAKSTYATGDRLQAPLRTIADLFNNESEVRDAMLALQFRSQILRNLINARRLDPAKIEDAKATLGLELTRAVVWYARDGNPNPLSSRQAGLWEQLNSAIVAAQSAMGLEYDASRVYTGPTVDQSSVNVALSKVNFQIGVHRRELGGDDHTKAVNSKNLLQAALNEPAARAAHQSPGMEPRGVDRARWRNLVNAVRTGHALLQEPLPPAGGARAAGQSARGYTQLVFVPPTTQGAASVVPGQAGAARSVLHHAVLYARRRPVVAAGVAAGVALVAVKLLRKR